MAKYGCLAIILPWVILFIAGFLLFNLIGCTVIQKKIVLIPGQKIEIKTFLTTYQIEVEPLPINYDGVNWKKYMDKNKGKTK
jgi:hypothetical protein